MRHPREMGAAEVEAFLTMLATEHRVSTSTHNQALSALLFLYREVLNIDLPWLNGVNRPTQKRRIPSVLTRDEVSALFRFLDGQMLLLAQLLYGTGMRLMEGLRLRIKDVDFHRRVIIVRKAKGGKDRVVMLPQTLAQALHGPPAGCVAGAVLTRPQRVTPAPATPSSPPHPTPPHPAPVLCPACCPLPPPPPRSRFFC